MPAEPTVSIVIPNLNGATPRDGLTYLDLVMGTLEGQSFRDFDVTVVDNGSTDESADYVRERWPSVRLVELSENLGFSAAINRGVDASGGRYVALLNNDVELSPDWLELLVAELERDPGVGFATGKVMRFGDRELIEQAGLDFYACGRFMPRGLDQPDRGQYDERRPTAVVTATAAVYRRQALDAVGGFDEDYFLYCEDGDVCLRMLLAGYSGLYLPEPVAFHVSSGTLAAQTDLRRFYMIRNGLITMAKDVPASTLVRSLPQIAVYYGRQLFISTVARALGTAVRAYGSFLRALPATIRKRRAIQRARRMSPGAFAAQISSGHPPPL